MTYITSKVIDVDVETGLDKEIRIVAITIDASIKTILITYKVVLVSPSPARIVLREIEENTVTRTNLECNPKWDQLESSPIGQGIKQMLQPDLEAYPNMSQADNC